MLPVHSGVDDGNDGVLAGVAQLAPHLRHGGHIRRVVHFQLEGRHRGNGDDIGQRLDLLHLRDGHICREGADQVGRLIDGRVTGDLLHAADDALLLAQSLRLRLLRLCVPFDRTGSHHSGSRAGFNHNTDDRVRVQRIRAALHQTGLRTLLPERGTSLLQRDGSALASRRLRVLLRRCRKRLNTQAAHQRQREKNREKVPQNVLSFHNFLPFL